MEEQDRVIFYNQNKVTFYNQAVRVVGVYINNVRAGVIWYSEERIAWVFEAQHDNWFNIGELQSIMEFMRTCPKP